jgi:hypothetical protein
VDWDLLTESGPAGIIKATRIETLSRSDEFSLAALMSRFREFDRLEFMAVVPEDVTPFNHLRDMVNETELCWSLSVDGFWEGIGGVHWDPTYNMGIPWLLLSDRLPYVHRHAFRRITKRINQIFFDHYAPLVNYVHRDSQSHRWLEWLGYTVHRDREHEMGGETFITFTYGI